MEYAAIFAVLSAGSSLYASVACRQPLRWVCACLFFCDMDTPISFAGLLPLGLLLLVRHVLLCGLLLLVRRVLLLLRLLLLRLRLRLRLQLRLSCISCAN